MDAINAKSHLEQRQEFVEQFREKLARNLLVNGILLAQYTNRRSRPRRTHIGF